MKEITPILRSRRERRLAKQRAASARARGTILSAGMIFSLILAALILVSAYAYADLTRDLPSVEILPRLLNPPDGLLLEPTRVYDRTGQHLLYVFAPNESPRRYIPASKQNPQHLPESLLNATVVALDPYFWKHSGYAISGFENPDLHPTLAQKLVSDLLLYDEPSSLRRALRERLLAAQITARYGRTQVLEWYINSANYGRYIFGADAAAQFYFNKTASDLTLAESAMLAATSQSPSLNPLEANALALQRAHEIIKSMQEANLVTEQEAANALAWTPNWTLPNDRSRRTPTAFLNLVFKQIEETMSLARVERGGVIVTTALDYELQKQTSCATEIYAARLAGLPEPNAECNVNVPPLPPDTVVPDSSASALILDPKTGQILAASGETLQGVETPLFAARRPGSSLDAFVYLTGFTRGLSPSSLTWDIAGQNVNKNFDNLYHGPMRLRTAMANDYQNPVEVVRAQMGMENVAKIAKSFGIDLNSDISLPDLAGAYGVFATDGIYFGQDVNGAFKPVTILRVETIDHAVWLDWTTPNARAVTTPALAYLMANSLSDELARWQSLGKSNATEIGRPAGVKLGQTADGLNAWTIGFTPARVVVTWTGARNGVVSPRLSAVLWNALMTTASRGLPADGWSAPEGITTMNVCDPSGLLPTRECPNVAVEVFLQGNEPTQYDNLFREFSINRETGLLATVFTPPELIDTSVYMVVPKEARSWALGAGIKIPPESFDAIQAPPINPFAKITSPALFSEVSGTVKIAGTASGDNFLYYRIQVGKGLNPDKWIQVGGDFSTSVTDGLLAEWNTTGLSGLYAIQLLVVRADQKVDVAVIQVTVK